MWRGVFDEIGLKYKQLSLRNSLLINDCPYKCMGNPPFSYILSYPFNNEVWSNYILNNLWPYLVGLLGLQVPKGMWGWNPHGEQLTKLNPQWKVIAKFAWYSKPWVNGSAFLSMHLQFKLKFDRYKIQCLDFLINFWESIGEQGIGCTNLVKQMHINMRLCRL
jgi:hypothetical protein